MVIGSSDTRGDAVPAVDPPAGYSGRLFQWMRYYVELLGLRNKGLVLLAVVVVVAWVNAGVYRVQPNEQGIVMRFGKWVETTGPGLHYHLPYPFEAVLFPKVTQVSQLQLGSLPTTISSGQDESRERQMLTGDENIVEAECAVLWRIKDAGQFLFRVKDAEAALKVSAESALREVIGRTPIQAAMSDKRQQIADQTRELLQGLLDRQSSGILVTEVQLQRVDPPAAVIDAFNDVQRARADQERARNEAEAYANDILPRARGEAARIVQEAEAYKAQAVNLAQGDAKGFLSVYSSYAKAKDVTAWRLYMESVDEVLKRATKVIIDTSGKGVGGVTPYLPLTDSKDKATPAKESQK
jgi:membrane protease subunit HflK